MAHIQIKSTHPDGGQSLIVNGVDLSMETFYGTVKLVSVGEEPWAQAGLQVTLVVGRLDIDDQEDIRIAGAFLHAAELVESATIDGSK